MCFWGVVCSILTPRKHYFNKWVYALLSALVKKKNELPLTVGCIKRNLTTNFDIIH